MPLPVCKIIYNNNQFGTYYAGQQVQGYVFLRLQSTKKIRGIKIKFLGEANVKWDETRSQNDSNGNSSSSTTSYTSNEEYLKFKHYLEGGEYSEAHELPPGDYEYPFNFVLPPNLPSSFEGKYGNIRYTIKVIIERPWRFNHEYKFAITVLDLLDLNLYPRLANKVEIADSKTFGLFSLPSSYFHMYVQLPRAGFVPGEEIPILIDCNNKSGNRIRYVSIKLVRNDEYHAKRPYKKSRKFSKTEVKLQTRGIESKSKTYFNEKIVIPPVVACGLKNCKNINVAFILKITAKVDAMFSRSMRMEIPIKIGTIPLYSSNPTTDDIKPTAPQIHSIPRVPSGSTSSSAPTTCPPYSPYLDDLPPYIPPPTYEESQNMLCSLRDSEDNKYTNIQDHYLPRYPVFHFSRDYKTYKD